MKGKNPFFQSPKEERATVIQIEKAHSPQEVSRIIESAFDDSHLSYRLKIVYLEETFGDYFEKFYDVLNYSKDNEEHNKIMFQLIAYSIIG